MRTTALLGAAVVAAGLVGSGSAPGADGQPAPSASAPIVVGIGDGGGPYVTAYDRTGRWKAGFLPYFDFSVGGLHVATGDVDADGKDDIVTVPGQGGRGEIRTFDPSGERKGPAPLATASGCGTRIAAGDVNGDGKADLVSGFEHCGPNVQVFDGVTGRRIAYFGAYNPGRADRGIRVAAGDVTGDGRAEVITGAGRGDQPIVRIFPGTTSQFSPAALRTIEAFGPTVTAGLEVVATDVNGDGRSDIVVGAETPDDAQVKVFDGATGDLLGSFRPFGLVSAGTLRIGAGDLDGDGRTEIVVGATTSYSPVVKVFSLDGTKLSESHVPLYNARSLAVGDLDGDGDGEIVAISGPGYSSTVVVFDPSGEASSWFQAYGYSFTQGVRVAAGDLDGNGAVEYVTGQGPGGHSELLALDADGNVLRELYPFGETGAGLYVASGDVDGDARSDIVAGAGYGEPRVKVFDGAGRETASFLAFDPTFLGGVRVATGDLDGDGTAEIVVATGRGGPPVVRIYDGAGQRRSSFFAFDTSYTDGLYVGAGDVTGDGKAEIVVGAGSRGDVRVFDASGRLHSAFGAYEAGTEFFDGVHVAVGDVDGDGTAEIVTGPGRVRPADVRVFDGYGDRVGGFSAHDEFQGGIFVAVPAPLGPRLVAAANDVRGVEGRRLQFVVSLVDPRGGAEPEKLAATVHWGDGVESAGAIAAFGGGRYTITSTHRYLSFGRYRVSVRIADTSLRGATVSAVARIGDAPLHARGRTIRARSLAFRGVVATVRDEDRLGSPLDLRARVSWGDGTRSRALVVEAGLGRFQIVAGHRFRSRGSHRVVVDVRSRGGSSAKARTTIRVTR